LGLLSAQQAKALPVSLGTAADFALLEMGPGSANVSIAQGGNVGFINGDIGIAPDGKLGISAGNFPITGTVYAWQSDGINTGGNAPVVVDLAKVQTAADDAFKASSEASNLGTADGGVGFTSINLAGNATLNLNPGVYNLDSINMGNSSQIILAAGGSYVFNITGSMKLDHAQILAPGLDPNEILYNLMGPKAATSGGLNDESVITGTLLVPFGDVSLTPGLVEGRILSGGSINIASGGAINAPIKSVPDAGSTMLLMSIGLGCLASVKRKFVS
jgi:hypothetical protein